MKELDSLSYAPYKAPSFEFYNFANKLFDNLQTIVLNEADRLLKAEEVALAASERKKNKEIAEADGEAFIDKKPRRNKKGMKPRLTLTFTEHFV